MLADFLDTLRSAQPDFSGAQVLNITNDSEKLRSFYMVTDYRIEDPYITFNHLIFTDLEKHISINAFPEKQAKQKTYDYIKKLEKDPKYTKIHVKLFVPTVEVIEFMGKFTYSKIMQLEDTHLFVARSISEVLDFKPKPKAAKDNTESDN
jgi:hypothetical protein